MMKVVVDTNILVASLFKGSSRELVEHWLNGRISLCVSKPILGEYRNILSRFMFREDRAMRLLDALEAGEGCLEAAPPRGGGWVPDDPEDDKFVACALELGADFIVSSDGHLRGLREVEGIRVVTPGTVNARI